MLNVDLFAVQIMTDKLFSRFDVIDPQRNITTRLKLNYIDESFISTFMVHADVLAESFFEKIELIEDEEDVQLNVQQLHLPQVLPCCYLIGQNFGGQNCRKSDLLPFCPPKILSAEI